MEPKEIFSHWNQIRTDLIGTINSFADDELGLIPFDNSWPIGQMMLHIADAEDGWLRFVVTKEITTWPVGYTLSNFPNKASIIQILGEVHSRTQQFIAGLSLSDLSQSIHAPWGAEFSLIWILWHMIEHEIHHRGELSLLLGYFGREGLDV
jgi:uncharacterized damage-inducible protein DinB